ncbi:uncharacterized protein LOC119180778 isoform X4 [Rhipicephalus microplus]|uniref:uncharacterized protein LOC119180778 isoform X4 n=1 Tax=Rhipicephalus microplus TaxID=6941 RepID=UPI003F6CCA72
MHCGIGGVSAAPAENHSLVEAVASEVHQDPDGTHDSTHNNVAEFAATPEGLFAPLQGIMINAEQATKIFNNKKVTIVVRDCAQAIWGEEALACKTVSGCSVPVEETKQLTPQKVHDVNGDAVMSVMHNLAAHYQDNACKLITQLHGLLHNSLLDILPSARREGYYRKKETARRLI